MGSKSKTKSSSNQVTRPNPTVAPYLNKVVKEASNIYDTSPKSYSGELVAQHDPNQLAGLRELLRQSPGLNTGAQELRDLGQKTARGDFLSYDSSPLSAYFNTHYNDARKRFQEGQLKAVEQGAIQHGAYGGSRQGVATALAERDFNDELQQQQTAVALANYQRERELQQRSGGLLEQANALFNAPGQQQLYVGDRFQEQQQRELQGDLAKFELNRTLPWQDIQAFSNLIAQHNPVGFGGQVKTDSKETTQTKPSALSTAVGIGLAGASLFGGGGPLAGLIGSAATGGAPLGIGGTPGSNASGGPGF